MDDFQSIFKDVEASKVSQFYKNVRRLTATRRNKTLYAQNLINLMHLYSTKKKHQQILHLKY